MSRQLVFVLLLGTGLALAGDSPHAQQAAGASEAQTPAKAAQERTDDADARTDAAPGEPGETAKAPAPTEDDAKLFAVPGGKALGMSILGNQDAPTSLVIVPWKTSELGGSPGIAPLLDDSRQPVDKDVFMRSLRYYEIRADKKP
jgi:hypothetical protein